MKVIETKTYLDTRAGVCIYPTVVNEVDWKLNAECNVIMNKLKSSPETNEFQRRDLDDNVETETLDPYFKFKLMVEELLVIFTKSEDKCGVCVEYIVKLCRHIGDTHEGSQDSESIPSDDNRHIDDHSLGIFEDITAVTACGTASRRNAYPSQNVYTNSCEVDQGNTVIGSCSGVHAKPLNLSIQSQPPPTDMYHLNYSDNCTKESIEKFTCKNCGKDFTKVKYLINHMISYHGQKQFNIKEKHKCELCGKNFPKQKYLTNHRISCPTDTQFNKKKKHKCFVCELRFISQKGLTEHFRTHTGEKPFKCDECEKTFARKFSVTLHKRTHNVEKQFKCAKCGKYFMTSYSRRRHMKRIKCKEMTSYNDNHKADLDKSHESLTDQVFHTRVDLNKHGYTLEKNDSLSGCTENRFLLN